MGSGIILSIFLAFGCCTAFSEAAHIFEKASPLTSDGEKDDPWKQNLCKFDDNGAIMFWAKTGYMGCTNCPIEELTNLSNENPICFICCHGSKKGKNVFVCAEIELI